MTTGVFAVRTFLNNKLSRKEQVTCISAAAVFIIRSDTWSLIFGAICQLSYLTSLLREYTHSKVIKYTIDHTVCNLHDMYTEHIVN